MSGLEECQKWSTRQRREIGVLKTDLVAARKERDEAYKRENLAVVLFSGRSDYVEGIRILKISYADARAELAAARKALVDVEGFSEEIWDKETRRQVHLARMEFDGPYAAHQRETTND